MARYFFHLHECGDVCLDEEGRELPNLAAAERAALTDARTVMAAEVMNGKLCMSCRIVIEDARGQEVAQLAFEDAVALTGL